MAQNIILKRSSLSGKVPTTSSLDLGEIALNTYDGRAFIHKSGSEETIEHIVVTNSITTGSINITYTGSFGEIDVTNDLNVGDSIYVTNDIVGGGDVDVVGAVTASFFVGDGSQLTGIDTSTDTEIPANEWDYNLPDSGSLSDGNNTSIKYTIDFQAEGYDVRPVGYQTFITNNNGSTEIIPGTEGILFIVNNQEVGRIGVEGIVATPSPGTVSGSSQLTSSFVQNSQTSSFVQNSQTSSMSVNYALTASYAENIQISGSITNVKSIAFDRTAGINVTEGQMAWNNSDGTLDIGLNFGDVVLQVGQEQHFVVRNATGTTISNGTAVYASGVSVGSKRIEVSPFTANGTIDEVRFLGLATHNISDGVNGVVTNFGYVRGLDTRGTSATALSVGDETWAEGDILYAHPTAAGKLTNVAPKDKITVAMITTRHQTTGVLFVRPFSLGHIDDLHDVQINTGSLVTGSMLEWNGDYFVNNDTFSSSINNSVVALNTLTGSLATTGSNTYTGLQTFQQIQEVISLKPSIGLGTHNFDFNSGSIFYVGGLTGSGTWNVQNIPSSSNTATSLTFVVEQGATAYTASAYQLGGTALTVKWLDGTVPTGSANSTDVIGLTTFRSGSSWNAIGSLSKFS